MRVVLDTNVIVSSFLSPSGTPARVVDAWRAGRYELLCSDFILGEYAAALSYGRVRRRHGLESDQVLAQIENFRHLAIVVNPADIPAVIDRDLTDDNIVACAVAGAADYIVSGDRHLLDLRRHAGIRILSPGAFALLLEVET